MSKTLKIPEPISQSTEMSSDEKLLLAKLLADGKYGEPQYVSVDQIASDLGLRTTDVRNALAFLALKDKVTVSDSKDELVPVEVGQITGISWGITIHCELRKSVGADGQRSMDLGEDEPAPNPLRVAIDDVMHELELTDDLEEPPAVFVNVWSLDDAGERLLHVIRGIQCLTRNDAMRWWGEYCEAGNDPFRQLGILDWMATLPAQQPDGENGEFVVWLEADTFEKAFDAAMDAIGTPDGVLALEEDGKKGILIWHARRYEIAMVDADPSLVYAYVAPADEVPDNPMDEPVGGEPGTVEVVAAEEAKPKGRKKKDAGPLAS